MHKIIKSLTQEQRAAFFFYPLEVCREAFNENHSQVGLITFCENYITWIDWEVLCKQWGLDQLARLPKRCYTGGLTDDKKALLKEAIFLFLSTKTTKTFEDLL